MHQSGHLAVLNSKALQIAGITAASKDPPGGMIRRQPGTQEPSGVVEEMAFFSLMGVLPMLSDSDREFIAKAGTRESAPARTRPAAAARCGLLHSPAGNW